MIPGLLGSWREFRARFERPIAGTEDPEEQERLTGELLQKLGHHYLRRAKDEVLRSLPHGEFKVLEVRLSASQLRQYFQIARHAKSAGRGAVLAAIQQLFRLCGHPQAMQGSTGLFEYQPGECPKLDPTIELLEGIRQRGEKAIIFTRWITLQEILRTALYQVFGLWVQVINGSTSGSRTEIVEQFSRKPGFNALILSHDVGGVGLTITAANHVIHYTRPWNPAKEAQATDRVHRIGQKKLVTVYYPIAFHPEFTTVEVRLDELLKEKMCLAKNVLRPTSALTVMPGELSAAVEAGGAMAGGEWPEGARGDTPGARPVEPQRVGRRAEFAAVWDACSRLAPGGCRLVHEIPEGATGYSFWLILGPFQRGARKAELCDPRLFRPESSAAALVEALSAAGWPNFTLRLTGSPPEPEDEELVRVQIESLRNRWAAHGVQLQVEEQLGISRCYARFDTGWRVVFSGGFDLFHRTGPLVPMIEAEQLATPCRETTVWIDREHIPESG